MELKDMIKALNLRILSAENCLNRQIHGVYINDLLSWVMSHGEKNNVWITVQIHPNIVAIAVLLELGCIIIPEGIEVEDKTISRANQENIVILNSDMNSYELAIELGKLGI